MISQEKGWFEHALIQQIYPLTFNAPNGGYGTLRGVIDKLDYVKDLGVDAVWLSPFFKSSLKKSLGYNVTSYTEIEPTFGTMKDCDDLIKGIHDRSMAVIFDMVFSHTSDENPWFKASEDPRHPEHAKYKDFYVWADRKSGSTVENPEPPNNWKTTTPFDNDFSAWKWSPKRQQYYFHNFAYNTPDLNLYNKAVVDELKQVLKFWIDKGVDGFRLDAIPYFTHREDLKDTEFPEGEVNVLKFEHQLMQPRTPEVLKELCVYAKELGKKKDGKNIFLLGEVSLDSPTLEEREKAERPDFVSGYDYAAMLVRAGAVDQAFTPVLWGGPKGALVTQIKMAAEAFMRRDEKGISAGLEGMDLAAENHDISRVVQRWELLPGDADPQLQHRYAILAGKLSLSMPGSLCIFQGQELGLPDADVRKYLHREGEENAAKRAQCDPQDLASSLYDFEGSRAMMPWSKEQVKVDNGWTGMPPGYVDFTPENNPTLAAYKEFIKFRKQSKALQEGNIEFIDNVPEDVIAFTRNADGDRRLCVFNFSQKEVTIDLPDGMKVGDNAKLTLPPIEGRVEEFTQRKVSPRAPAAAGR